MSHSKRPSLRVYSGDSSRECVPKIGMYEGVETVKRMWADWFDMMISLDCSGVMKQGTKPSAKVIPFVPRKNRIRFR